MRLRIRYAATAVTAAALALGGVATATTATAKPGVANIAEWSHNTAGVKCIQNALNLTSGAGLGVDGIFGPSTLTAVQHFQAAFGLAQDGVVGPDTGGWLGWSYDQYWSNDYAWSNNGCYNVVPSH